MGFLDEYKKGASYGTTPGLISGMFGGSSSKKQTAEQLNPNLTAEAVSKDYTLPQYRKIKPMLDWIGQYQQGVEEANKANEERYQQGLGVLGNMSSMYANFQPAAQVPHYQEYGKGQRANIEEQRRAGTAEAMSGLVGSGLAASSVAPAVQRQFREGAARQNMELSDAIAQYQQQRRDYLYQQNLGLQRERIGNQAGVMGQKLAWIYGKEDVGPDPGFTQGVLGLMASKPGMWKTVSEPYAKKWGIAG